MHLAAERSYPTPVSNSVLLPLLLLSLARQRHTPDGSKKIKKEYDYVIVGAGSAGSVVASRLTEERCVSVLLLEAGHEPPLLTEVPAFGRSFWFTDVDWQFKTAPQKHTARALINRQMLWPSGKMIGGSSSINGLRYVRGNRKNYDDWAAQGAKGWSYKEIFPYFLKLEDNKEHKFLANGYHTTGGPMTVHRPRYDSEVRRAVYKAATGMGYKVVDPNAARQTGFYDHQANLRDNQRCSTAKAYLVPAENRTNLDILPNARARKIIIQERQARGVLFDFRGHTYEVKARKEVIVSAGTINTAKLLMLSGVGPKKELQRLKIPIVADLPVGQNLQDHGETFVPYVINSHIPDFQEKISDPDNIQQYIHNRTGPLASTEGINYLAFLKDQEIHPYIDFPNYQLYFGEASTNILRDQLGLRPEVYRQLYGPYENKPLFMCEVSQLQPRSKGKVTLRSKNPYDSPIIDPNYLADPRDVEDMVQGIKTCHRIASSRPLRKLGVRPFKTLIPGCEKYAHDEEKYSVCQVRSIFTTIHHAVGTAKMGDPWDPTTVVDPQLRVKNIKGLRVVDASIMPIVTSGNTNIPAIMIAEKASDMIKETIHCHKKEIESWDEPKETEWSEDDESWKDEKQWRNPKDEEIIWIEEDESWEDKKQWEKPNEKETTWSEDDESWEDIKQWKKPKEKETSWSESEEPWENKKQWQKPKEKETSWSEDDESWEDKKQWEKPNEKETTWSEDDESWEDIKQWKKPKEKETSWSESEESWENKKQWQKPKEKETSWSEEEYINLPKQQWDDSKESWSGDDYKKDYQDVPLTSSWSDIGKYHLKDYIKDSEELSTLTSGKSSPDSYSKDSLSYSGHRKQTDLLLKQINQPVDSKWEHEKKITQWNAPENFEVTKSVEELVKLADHVPESKTITYNGQYSYTKSKLPWFTYY